MQFFDLKFQNWVQYNKCCIIPGWIGGGVGGEGGRRGVPHFLACCFDEARFWVMHSALFKNCNLCVSIYTTAIIKGCIQLDKLTLPKHLFLKKVGIQSFCLFGVTDIHM